MIMVPVSKRLLQEIVYILSLKILAAIFFCDQKVPVFQTGLRSDSGGISGR